jgi:hypothetical protein
VRQQREAAGSKQVSGNLTDAERQALLAEESRLRSLTPNWLIWAAAENGDTPTETLPDDPAERARRIETVALAKSPQILARFDLPGRPPFLVSRQMGRGEIMFCSTGLLSSWNTLPKTNAVLIFDRILRAMTQSTLPRRNFPATPRLSLSLPPQEQNLLVTLARPGQKLGDEPLDVGYINPEQRGVTLTALLQRGVYHVRGARPSLSSNSAVAPDKPVWDVPLVVSGPAEESDLTPLRRDQYDELAAGGNLRWVGVADEISLAGVAIRGQTSWWWLVLTALALLLLEMTVLAWPTWQPPPIPT